MGNKNENMTGKLSDQQLKDVSGCLLDVTHSGDEVVIYTDNSSWYSSGDTPKYAVDQKLKIQVRQNRHHYMPCKVLSVSETATGGTIFTEFVYSVEILPGELDQYIQLTGKVYHGVYESCLYE